ncbi:MAG: cytochrome d ubiquinol oxidase subunit II [Bacteroidales bacterium]|nr:cytochrome d ubiquinol oxidase subunit II [Bacteroidales bacterium]
MTYEFLQNYWWAVVSLLGALLVFLMFVQGANVQLASKRLSDREKRMVLNSTGRKWELTFTTLVTFGGAFFASFPLFYSTSFGGAYWVWILILLTFVFQAVSYEFHSKKANLLGSRAFRSFLVANGVLAPILIGTAVGTFFTGSDFTVNKEAILGPDSPVISIWGNSLHGLEALGDLHAVCLGLAIMSLTIILGALYALNNVDDENINGHCRRVIKIASPAFLVLFIVWLVVLLVRPGYAVDASGTVFMEKAKYLHNFLNMPIVLVMFLAGVVLVLLGIFKGGFTKSRKGIWSAGLGTVLTVLAVFMIAGYGGTAFYPSSTDLQSSLTIRNASSSLFTLKTMFYVSFAVPFVLAYIIYAWRQMDKKPISGEEIDSSPHQY